MDINSSLSGFDSQYALIFTDKITDTHNTYYKAFKKRPKISVTLNNEYCKRFCLSVCSSGDVVGHNKVGLYIVCNGSYVGNA